MTETLYKTLLDSHKSYQDERDRIKVQIHQIIRRGHTETRTQAELDMDAIELQLLQKDWNLHEDSRARAEYRILRLLRASAKQEVDKAYYDLLCCDWELHHIWLLPVSKDN
jgi:hypothetical protein